MLRFSKWRWKWSRYSI